MEQVYQWVLANPVLSGAIGGVLALLLSVCVSKTARLKIGFTISQFARRFGGNKLEEELDEFVEDVAEGMKSDNSKKG